MVTLTKKFALFLISLNSCANLFAADNTLKIGVQFFETGELEKAKSFFEEFVEENEKNSEAFYYLVTTDK